MKAKKTAFSNSSTGYGRQKHYGNKSTASKFSKDTKTEKDMKNDKPKQALDNEKDLNSGFGDYLRSPEAVEMMKLFVFANTIMLLVTLAWPNIKEQYYMLNQWLNSFRND